jgi:hypothetical protein
MNVKEVEEKIHEALNGIMPLTDFVEWYGDWYYQNLIIIKEEINSVLCNALTEFNNDSAFFVPHPEVRKNHHSYYGETELIANMEKLLREITNIK